ncbi:adenylyl-sulfate kinase [Bradyrhizobium sp.]|uniref:adenylyl-sulfate kinase n=1 Tax=Bradyrhizobium sp. TaxID=376 RepID=UPI002C040513|nr:adenylyl-sulfate kinase [Bradyrhizobium sp.]HMM88274.1 adenylyl-sulfate kinase [Bradyrhizobium sp.]
MAAESSGNLRIVVVGHVDHGKSTMIGRLLHDTGSLPEGKIEELRQMSERRGMPLEWSFVLDSFQAERDQAITIDTTRIWLRTPGRDTVIIDAPGHREFLKNMISGASDADAAVLVVDAVEGMRDQTRRHAFLLKLLGFSQIAVVINKIDLLDDPKAKFTALSEEVRDYLGSLDLVARFIIPISAYRGDNLVNRSDHTGWYSGPTLTEALDHFQPQRSATDRPLLIQVQDVYKFDERRIIAGRVTSGTVRNKDRLLFSPGDRTASVARIESFGHSDPPTSATAGESVGLILDEQIFVERGQVASLVDSAPPLSDVFRAQLFWLANQPMKTGASYRIKLGTAIANVTVKAIESVVDLDTLDVRHTDRVERNDLANVVLRASTQLPFPGERHDPALGRFVLLDGFDVAGGGLASLEGFPDQRRSHVVAGSNIKKVESLVTRTEREARSGHRGIVIWLTGLSGAGKSTLAQGVDRLLFSRGFNSFVLDGDNLRQGLNSDLGFAPDQRVENIRRVGEVAALFASAGTIVLSAFISPYQVDRARARAAAAGSFHEIYVKASIETCEKRDTKGLYRKARTGEIKEFTGVSAPYEVPVMPDLVVDTDMDDVSSSVTQLVEYITRVSRV